MFKYYSEVHVTGNDGKTPLSDLGNRILLLVPNSRYSQLIKIPAIAVGKYITRAWIQFKDRIELCEQLCYTRYLRFIQDVPRDIQ